jgi:hypothetical protein
MELRLNHLWMKMILSMVVTVPLFAQVPSVWIDTPTAGATISGTITVSGWALDNFANTPYANSANFIATVLIAIDGSAVGLASIGVSRPDVCQVMPNAPGCPNVGWAYSLNTATLSAGQHSITAIAYDDNIPPDIGSTTTQVTVGPPPLVFIDSPTPGSVVGGTINVTGWALANTPGQATPINSVQVLVDGVAAGNAIYGVSRTDVCSVYPAGANCPNVGYTFSLNTAAYSLGAHTITVMAADSSTTGSATTNITVIAAPSVFIDAPTPGAVVSGVVTIDGWAIDNATSIGTGISSVQILVDGNAVGTANYGVTRADVCDVYPGRPNCPNVGFTYQLNTAALTPGSHTVTAMAADAAAIPDSGVWTINITVASQTLVTIENPTAGAYISGTYVTLSGWALDTNGTAGTPISSVQVSVDGAPLGPAFYGYFPRPDICSSYPGSAGCPNVGFFYYLNANSLSPGAHTITVTATDSSNPPNSASTNVSVNVAN